LHHRRFIVEFLEGRIEAVPLPDASVDVVVSNCVIGLSARKDAVFGEAFRVLRPGGRFAVADIIADRELDAPGTADTAEWAACLAGALTRDQYLAPGSQPPGSGTVRSPTATPCATASRRCSCAPAGPSHDPGAVAAPDAVGLSPT
jgi:SAM-dependent methyltransferase